MITRIALVHFVSGISCAGDEFVRKSHTLKHPGFQTVADIEDLGPKVRVTLEDGSAFCVPWSGLKYSIEAPDAPSVPPPAIDLPEGHCRVQYMKGGKVFTSAAYRTMEEMLADAVPATSGYLETMPSPVPTTVTATAEIPPPNSAPIIVPADAVLAHLHPKQRKWFADCKVPEGATIADTDLKTSALPGATFYGVILTEQMITALVTAWGHAAEHLST